MKVIDFITDNWGVIAGVYEIIIRVIPTGKNLSIIDNVFKAVSFIIKNRRKPQPTDVVVDESHNTVVVDRKKHIIPIILLFALACLPGIAEAQTNLTGKSVRLYNADSATVRTEAAALVSMYDSVFVMYFNEQSSPAKLRCFTVDRGWYDCPTTSGGGGGGLTTADNGLTVSPAGNVRGGGPLLPSGLDITGTGTESFSVSNPGSVGFTPATAFNVQSLGNIDLYAGTSITIDNLSFGGSSDISILAGGSGTFSVNGSLNLTSSTGTTVSSATNVDLSPTQHLNAVAGGDITMEATQILTAGSVGRYVYNYSSNSDDAPVLLLDYDGSGVNSPGALSFLLKTGDYSGGTTGYSTYEAVLTTPTLVSTNILSSGLASGKANIQMIADDASGGINSFILLDVAGRLRIDADTGVELDGNIGAAGEVFTSNGPGLPATWAPVSGGSGTADNGITETAGNFQLGGALIQNTSITGATGAFNLSLGTTGAGSLNNAIVTVDNLFQLVDATGFSNFNLLASDGSFTMQTGTSGSTTSTFQIANGTQTSPTDNGLVYITKGNILADNDTISYILTAGVITQSGDGANGYGTGIRFSAENSGGGGNEQIGALAFTYKDATTTSEDTRAVIKLLSNSLSYDAFEVWSDNSGTTHIKIGSALPTSCTGLSSGELANISGVLNVCP